MLIKLTNQCSMNCPHCMDDAKDVGDMMTIDTFRNAVSFGMFLGDRVFTLSGGEPTENEKIVDMCKLLDRSLREYGGIFTIVSNGMWLKDERKRFRVKRICEMKAFAAMQVYTNKKWYKEYDYVVEHRNEYELYPGVIVDVDSKIFMDDLGRARTNEKAQEEVKSNTHFMSCTNAILAAIQALFPSQCCSSLNEHKQFCKPQVDCNGFVRMSESCLCPSVGNVNTESFDYIWKKMRDFRPCGKCYQYKVFMESDRIDAIMAKDVLGISK